MLSSLLSPGPVLLLPAFFWFNTWALYFFPSLCLSATESCCHTTVAGVARESDIFSYFLLFCSCKLHVKISIAKYSDIVKITRFLLQPNQLKLFLELRFRTNSFMKSYSYWKTYSIESLSSPKCNNVIIDSLSSNNETKFQLLKTHHPFLRFRYLLLRNCNLHDQTQLSPPQNIIDLLQNRL